MNKKHKQPEKNIKEKDSMFVKNVIDCKSVDVKFDGITRVVAIGERKLLVMTEKGAS